MALPFFAHHEIRPMFVCPSIQAETQPLPNLIEYIPEQWIDSNIFLPREWSVFKQPIRTNNDLDGLHNALNRRACGKCRLEFYLLIQLLHREAHLTSITIQLVSDKKLKRIQRKKVQATSAETVRRLGAVPDRQQKRLTTTPLLNGLVRSQ